MLFFTNKLTVLHLAKEDCLLHEGEVCRAVYFVNRGSFRQYSITDDVDEITLNFFIEEDWVLDYQSFTSQKPSKSIIQATENSEVFKLNIHDLHTLIERSGAFFQMGRLLEKALDSQEYRSGHRAPEEKYRQLMSTKPRIVQRFPLKQIASYLAMTPETLSRVRKKLTQSSDFLI